MNTFENITVYKNQYVKIKAVKVKIPITFSEEEVSFSTTNRELIHLFINQHPIFSNSDYNQCVNKLVEVIVKDKNLTQKQKCMYETWNTFGISLDIGGWHVKFGNSIFPAKDIIVIYIDIMIIFFTNFTIIYINDKIIIR